MSEQIELMRRLWTERSVTFTGQDDTVNGAGLAPLPVQRPIPVWIGGSSRPAYRRIGRVADGWFPQVPPDERLEEARSVVAEAAAEAGRDPAQLGMEGRVSWTADGEDKLADRAGQWRKAGASHLSVNTMGAGLSSVDDHLEALGRAAAAVGLRAGSDEIRPQPDEIQP